MAYAILGTPKPAFFDSSGAPLASGTLTITDPDTDAAKNTFPTATLADANSGGVSTAYTLDSRGEIATQLWGRDGEDYKVLLKDSDAAQIYEIDEIRTPPKSRRATVTFTAADATPSIAEGTHFITNGTTTITDFDDGQVGDTIHITNLSNDIMTITANPSVIVLAQALDCELEYYDTITLTMFTDQVWTEIARGDALSSRYVLVNFTNVLTQAESGKTIFLGTGGYVTTLPAPAWGCNFKFIVKTAPGGTAYTIVTNGSATIIYGLITDINATTPTQPANAEHTLSFVANTALPGDYAEFVSDGLNWYMQAATQADGGITVTAA